MNKRILTHKNKALEEQEYYAILLQQCKSDLIQLFTYETIALMNLLQNNRN